MYNLITSASRKRNGAATVAVVLVFVLLGVATISFHVVQIKNREIHTQQTLISALRGTLAVYEPSGEPGGITASEAPTNTQNATPDCIWGVQPMRPCGTTPRVTPTKDTNATTPTPDILETTAALAAQAANLAGTAASQAETAAASLATQTPTATYTATSPQPTAAGTVHILPTETPAPLGFFKVFIYDGDQPDRGENNSAVPKITIALTGGVGPFTVVLGDYQFGRVEFSGELIDQGITYRTLVVAPETTCRGIWPFTLSIVDNATRQKIVVEKLSIEVTCQ